MTTITALDIKKHFDVNHIFAYYLSSTQPKTEDDIMRDASQKSPNPLLNGSVANDSYSNSLKK